MQYYIIKVTDTEHNNCVEQMFGCHSVYYEGIGPEGVFLYDEDASEACTFISAGNVLLFWDKYGRDILKSLPDFVNIYLCSITFDERGRSLGVRHLNTLYNKDDFDKVNNCSDIFTFNDFKRLVSPAIIDKIMQENPNASNNTLFSNILVELNSAWETVNGKCTKWVPGHFE